MSKANEVAKVNNEIIDDGSRKNMMETSRTVAMQRTGRAANGLMF